MIHRCAHTRISPNHRDIYVARCSYVLTDVATCGILATYPQERGRYAHNGGIADDRRGSQTAQRVRVHGPQDAANERIERAQSTQRVAHPTFGCEGLPRQAVQTGQKISVSKRRWCPAFVAVRRLSVVGSLRDNRLRATRHFVYIVQDLRTKVKVLCTRMLRQCGGWLEGNCLHASKPYVYALLRIITLYKALLWD